MEAGGRRRDALGLVIAGVVNTVLAPAVVAVVLAPGMPSGGGDATARAAWIAANPAPWQAGWAFWFVVTITFAWSYLALGPHLAGRGLAMLGMAAAVVALAVDLVGITISLVATPIVAAGARAELFVAVDGLGQALVSGVSFGLYSLAGLLLTGAARGTPGYPRSILVVGWVLWTVSAVAVLLLGPAPGLAAPLLVVGILLYGPWAWLNARWLLRGGAA